MNRKVYAQLARISQQQLLVGHLFNRDLPSFAFLSFLSSSRSSRLFFPPNNLMICVCTSHLPSLESGTSLEWRRFWVPVPAVKQWETTLSFSFGFEHLQLLFYQGLIFLRMIFLSSDNHHGQSSHLAFSWTVP